jgi:hypothetical protein
VTATDTTPPQRQEAGARQTEGWQQETQDRKQRFANANEGDGGGDGEQEEDYFLQERQYALPATSHPFTPSPDAPTDTPLHQELKDENEKARGCPYIHVPLPAPFTIPPYSLFAPEFRFPTGCSVYHFPDGATHNDVIQIVYRGGNTPDSAVSDTATAFSNTTKHRELCIMRVPNTDLERALKNAISRVWQEGYRERGLGECGG